MSARIGIHRLAFLACAVSALVATPVQAHGFGQRYDLPIPLSFYVFGAGATVALSFIMAAMFLKTSRQIDAYPCLGLLQSNRSQKWATRVAIMSRAIGVGYFVLMIAAGLWGTQSPSRNIIVVSVWIIGWVGISLCSALVGNVWRILNPWDTVFAAAEQIYARCRSARSLALSVPYPPVLDVWPAVSLFLLFAWMELIWTGRDVPARVAHAMLLYSVITWLGMFIFGRETWRQHADVFTIVFGIFSRFAPLTLVEGIRNELTLRLPAIGLLEVRRTSGAMMLLVVALLATVTFDGMLETPLWSYLDIAIINAPDDSFLWTVFAFSEAAALQFARTIGLVLFVTLFSAVYVLTCTIMARTTHCKYGSATNLARRFVFTLLPISIAYHVAHYFSYLFNGGQLIIPLLSDPFGFDWNLLGTAAYRPNISLVGPYLQWYVAVGAVVSGHIIAVYIAHVTALSTFGERWAALRSQIPIVTLMVGYTMLSLWILSQPIVGVSSSG